MDNNKKESITKNTVIGSRKITAAEFRKFFKKTLGDDYEKYPVVMSVIKVSLNHKGKTLKEIIEECYNPTGNKTMEEILAEDRFNIISMPDKAFIIAFTKVLQEAGYDFGGTIFGNKDLRAIVYGKTETKTRPCPARIHIDNDGSISLRLYLHKVDDHRQYIENAPQRIKNLFINDTGKCIGCNLKNGKCKCTKIYTVNGRLYNKCYFMITETTVEHIPDYINILSEFYPMKNTKSSAIN